ncbi:DNA-binding CsgD family transcriptional regulator [Sphingobium sp. B11D3B]|uniref:helix-turn-helix transcriptional regulator n=1 Tax=Sphingobium sp. B11D3B TaxID=2940575 RepID=UPI002225E636|nr:LuxR family transcriptional regulator [Sphingobium sp. B11D3B]MCW2387214.1 DNA-binding CsgD family transcriptional regulator [Sphingobium sp. B11D3B]
MNDILEKIAEASSLPLLWRGMTRYYARNGFGAVSYYWVKIGTNMPATLPLQHGFSKKEVALYCSFDFQRLDIVPRAALAAGVPIRWHEVWGNTELTVEERQFLEAMRQIDFTDGFSLPCYGPGNRNGVVGLGRIAPGADLSEERMTQLHFAAQAAHLRICGLFSEETGRERQLSAREKEILHWVARGKSNTVIADILQISPGTVDTYMRRIYEKLEVSDRTSAAVKGVGSGLIAA